MEHLLQFSLYLYRTGNKESDHVITRETRHQGLAGVSLRREEVEGVADAVIGRYFLLSPRLELLTLLVVRLVLKYARPGTISKLSSSKHNVTFANTLSNLGVGELWRTGLRRGAQPGD